jgi:hypothetical protein
MCEEELVEKLENLEIRWRGRGAIRFITTTKPETILACMRSIHQLAVYLAHLAPFDNLNTTAADLRHALREPYEMRLCAAAKLWFELPAAPGRTKLDPIAQASETTYRISTVRRGSHKFTSMDASKECAESVFRLVKWKAKMRDFDVEVVIEILDNQLWSGLALHYGLLSARNRTVLGPTTLSSAVYARTFRSR